MSRWIWILLLASCASTTTEYERRQRNYEPGTYAEPARPAHGSLVGVQGGWLEDVRPRQVGDVIVIRIDESDSASHDSGTKLERSSGYSMGIQGALDKIDPSLGLSELFGTTSDYDFKGSGQIHRRGRVSAVLPVRVLKVLPNGDFFVEGTKIVRIADEERHLYVSGLVRPTDIRADGSVSSSRLADAEVEYTGKGDASEQEHRGWLAGLLAKIWPF